MDKIPENNEPLRKGPSRRLLFIWGTAEILLALALGLIWQSDTGISYWLRPLIQTVLTIFGLTCLKDGFFSSDKEITRKTWKHKFPWENQ